MPRNQESIELEVVHPGERDPEAVEALLEALAEFCVDAWLARRGPSHENGVADKPRTWQARGRTGEARQRPAGPDHKPPSQR